MRHYLLLKFHQGYMSDEVLRLARETYDELARQLPGVGAVRVRRNCVVRGSNADLMVCMDLAGQQVLHEYLAHPLHQAFVRKMEGQLAERLSFDCVEDETEERRETTCTARF